MSSIAGRPRAGPRKCKEDKQGGSYSPTPSASGSLGVHDLAHPAPFGEFKHQRRYFTGRHDFRLQPSIDKERLESSLRHLVAGRRTHPPGPESSVLNLAHFDRRHLAVSFITFDAFEGCPNLFPFLVRAWPSASGVFRLENDQLLALADDERESQDGSTR